MLTVPKENSVLMACALSFATQTKTAFKERFALTNSADPVAMLTMTVARVKLAKLEDVNVAKASSVLLKDAETLMSVKVAMSVLKEWFATTNPEPMNAFALLGQLAMPNKAALNPTNVSMMHSALTTWPVSWIL